MEKEEKNCSVTVKRTNLLNISVEAGGVTKYNFEIDRSYSVEGKRDAETEKSIYILEGGGGSSTPEEAREFMTSLLNSEVMKGLVGTLVGLLGGVCFESSEEEKEGSEEKEDSEERKSSEEEKEDSEEQESSGEQDPTK